MVHMFNPNQAVSNLDDVVNAHSLTRSLTNPVSAHAGGEKRLYMYPPSFNCYPMPTVHPQTRVTRIYDIRNVDPSFHRFHSHPGMLAHIKPGDSLYIPFMWFHYVEHVRHTPRPVRCQPPPR